jgi:hypothetical protein
MNSYIHTKTCKAMFVTALLVTTKVRCNPNVVLQWVDKLIQPYDYFVMKDKELWCTQNMNEFSSILGWSQEPDSENYILHGVLSIAFSFEGSGGRNQTQGLLNDKHILPLSYITRLLNILEITNYGNWDQCLLGTRERWLWGNMREFLYGNETILYSDCVGDYMSEYMRQNPRVRIYKHTIMHIKMCEIWIVSILI